MKITDFDDIRQHFGLDAVRDQILEAIPAMGHYRAEENTERKLVWGLADVLQMPRPAMLIDKVLPKQSLSAITGPTGSWKSFFIINMASSLSRGADFFGFKTKQAACLIIAGEGVFGLRGRFKALQKHQGIKDTPSNVFIRSGFDLLNKDDLAWVSGFITENNIEAVFIDTFARAFVGDENSSRDVGAAIANIDRHIIAQGASCMLVHHTGHGATDRARGSSAFRAALDAEIGFEPFDDGVRVKCWKSKDLEPFEDFAVSPVTVETGDYDEHGIALTSLVLEPCNVPDKKLALSPQQQDVANVISGLGRSFSFNEIVLAVTTQTDITRNRKRVITDTIVKLGKSGVIEECGGLYLKKE